MRALAASEYVFRRLLSSELSMKTTISRSAILHDFGKSCKISFASIRIGSATGSSLEFKLCRFVLAQIVRILLNFAADILTGLGRLGIVSFQSWILAFSFGVKVRRIKTD